jgi:ABC-2 type transport system ATP-binding protein
LIDIEALRFSYGRKAALFEQFDLRLSAPGLYGLFGRNGSGKSTLLKLASGLLFPQGGRINVGGNDPQRRHPDFLAGIYLVPEEFHLPDLSCEQLARLHAGFYPRFRRDVFDEALSTFDIDPQTPFERMSLGTKKKAVIAFALATLTPILLLDEPTNGMDIVGRDQFRQLLRRPEQAGRIVLISTHQAHDLEQVISQILFIDRGRLALSSSMDGLARRLRMGITDS